MNTFTQPMLPFPGLERWARLVQLPKSGLSLHVYDTGTEAQPAVLLVHGLGDEADTWRHVLPRLNATYRVIAPDLPGFGRSAKPRRGYSIAFFIDTLIELLDALSIPRAVLVGHSMGAVIAQAAGLEHPNRVDRLVLISGSLFSKQNRVNAQLLFFLTPFLGEWLYNRLRKDPQAAYQSLAPYYYQLEDLPQADRNFLYRRVNERVWSDGQRLGFLSSLRSLAGWLPSQQKDLPGRLAGCQIPTSVLWGDTDRIQPVENGQALVKLLPLARLEVVQRAGHNLHQEQPDVVVKAVDTSGIEGSAKNGRE